MLNPRLLAFVTKNPNVVRVTASGFMGETEMDLPLDMAAYLDCIRDWKNGTPIQNAFPMLDATEREFLLTGMTAKQQAVFFKK